jgi:chemotaxis protein CheX
MTPDMKFLKPFIEGTVHTIKVQCSTETVPGMVLTKPDPTLVRFDIAAIIGLTSAELSGAVTLYFPKDVFLGLIGRMFKEQYPEITSELEDGAGELLNIIFGHAKRILNTQGYAIERAIPVIFRGGNGGGRPKPLVNAKPVQIPFKTDLGDFLIEIMVEKIVTSAA